MRLGLLWAGLGLLAALPARANRGAATPVPVRVMLVPHSHEDPGWTQTINEYYNGWVLGAVAVAPAIRPSRPALDTMLLQP